MRHCSRWMSSRPAGAEQSARLGGPPLVGRAAEWSRLVELWRGIEEGRAHLVLITGEPGIGKTRLVEEFRSWGVRRGAVAAEARSYAAEGAVAYGAVVAWLRSEELSPRLRRLDRPGMTELARLLPDLLTTVPGLAHPDPLPADDQRRRVFDAVARVLCAPGLPLLLVADDLQWCDRETLQFLHYLLRTAGDAHLLVVGTARREETDRRHPLNDLLVGLRALDRCTEIELGRLSPAETATVAEWMAGHPVADPEAKRLYGETEGNPLFVVEALRAGWERDTPADQWISPRVQAAIETRLTQLATPVRSLVDLAAAIGREFTTDVLADASGVDEETLVQALDDLWRRRIIREQGPAGYDFSHDKIREAAYRSLSPARRRQAHARVARALEGRHAPEPGPIAGQIAAHLEQAGAIPEAVTWYERAAAEAQRLHSNVEAIRLLERALELLHALPETAERHERELVILAAMPPSLGWVEGWASERLATVHQRSLDLAGVLGTELSPLLLRSMAIASLSRRDFVTACERGEQLRARGVRDADDMLLVEAGYVLGIAAFWQGEFEAARGHFQAAVERYRPEHRHAHIVRYGLDPKVICQSRLGNTLWFLGRPNAAMRASRPSRSPAKSDTNTAGRWPLCSPHCSLLSFATRSAFARVRRC
jgi:tetratricopeptide (TPR) repeat protein